jgi:hypothetical protein
MNGSSLYIVCGIIIVLALGMFLRAWILGNRSMQKFSKDHIQQNHLNQ